MASNYAGNNSRKCLSDYIYNIEVMYLVSVLLVLCITYNIKTRLKIGQHLCAWILCRPYAVVYSSE